MKKKPSPELKKETIVNKKTTKSFIDIDFVKEEYLRWICVIFLSVFCYSALLWVISQFYHPDIEALKAKAYAISLGIGGIFPEPHESLFYQLGVALFPIMFFVFYWVSKKKAIASYFKNQSLFNVIAIISSLLAAIGIYAVFAAANPNYVGEGNIGANEQDAIAKTNFDFYFNNLFLHTHFFIYLFILMPLILALFFGLMQKRNYDEKKSFNNFFSFIGWSSAILLMIYAIAISCFEFPYTWQNKNDFDTIYFSMVQVHSGNPMLVDGFTNTYGLFPHFLNPIFQVIGLSISKFTAVMGILIALCFFCQTFFLHHFTKNRVLFFFGAMSIFFLPYLNHRLQTAYDSEFAIYPIRIITFSLLLFLSCFYLKSKSNKIFFIISILQGIFAIWNPEIGGVVFVAWMAFLVYVNFYTADGKIAYLDIIKKLASTIGILLLVFVVYACIIKLRYGSFPDFIGMYMFVYAFASLGIYVIPMALVNPWQLFAFIYIVGLFYSIVQLYNKKITPKASAIFLMSILGIGLFSYYTGRSHNWNLVSFSAVALILLVLLTDELWVLIKQTNLMPLKILFSVCVFVLAVSSVEIYANVDKILKVLDDKKDKINQRDEEMRIKENQRFIAQNTQKEEKVYIFSSVKYVALLFDGAKNSAAVYPSYHELNLRTERERYVQRLRDSSYKVFIEPGYFYYGHYDKICAAIAAGYQYALSTHYIAMLTKRVPDKNYRPEIVQQSSSIFYKAFSDDTAGFAARLHYAFGDSSIQVGSAFSTEIVFDAVPQIYQLAVLASNATDSAGFSIVCGNFNELYYVTFPNSQQAYPFYVRLNSRNHLAVEIKDNRLQIKVNGVSQTYSLAAPYIPTSNKMSIGNSGHLRYYVGAIREVAFTKL